MDPGYPELRRRLVSLFLGDLRKNAGSHLDKLIRLAYNLIILRGRSHVDDDDRSSMNG